MIILTDTKEKNPWLFEGYPNTVTGKKSLLQGDYALQGFENEICIERKSESDFLSCLGADKPRFLRQLARARGVPGYVIVVESTWGRIAAGGYRYSRLSAATAMDAVADIFANWKVPIFFAGAKKDAERFAHGYFMNFLAGKKRQLRLAMKMAEGEMQEGVQDAEAF